MSCIFLLFFLINFTLINSDHMDIGHCLVKIIAIYVKLSFQLSNFLCNNHLSQGPSRIIFVKKMVQRCGVWQIKRMTSLDQDQVSMKSNMFGFRGYSQVLQNLQNS